ncbi:hypothetical protein [Brucella sp. IR073]|uniref:hypothetical protein n=1 Tax=unclassified Brucella TaxID=2632610 RepID=UPI003B984E52
MPYLELARPSFTQSGKTIEEILFKGACGGPAAVRCYLQTRRSMFLREIALESESDNGAAFSEQLVAALDRAIEILSHIESNPVAFAKAGQDAM